MSDPPHDVMTIIQVAASHVAFGVTSPAQPASPQRRLGGGSRAAAAATVASSVIAVADDRAAAGSQAGSSRPSSPHRQHPETDGEYDVTVTSSPAGPAASLEAAPAAAGS
jgi:hypothetical protein